MIGPYITLAILISGDGQQWSLPNQNQYQYAQYGLDARTVDSATSLAATKVFLANEDYQKAEETLLLNIEKWTYIEQYLNTPGATLDMPLLQLPIRHLASSVEMLGRYYLLRERLADAQVFFERGCPLMELAFGLEMENVAFCYSTLVNLYATLPGKEKLAHDLIKELQSKFDQLWADLNLLHAKDTVPELDKLASRFMRNAARRKALLSKAKKLVRQLQKEGKGKNAEFYPKFMAAIMKEEPGYLQKEQERLQASKNDPTLSQEMLLQVYAQSKILASFVNYSQPARADPYSSRTYSGQQHDDWYHNAHIDSELGRRLGHVDYYHGADDSVPPLFMLGAVPILVYAAACIYSNSLNPCKGKKKKKQRKVPLKHGSATEEDSSSHRRPSHPCDGDADSKQEKQCTEEEKAAKARRREQEEQRAAAKLKLEEEKRRIKAEHRLRQQALRRERDEMRRQQAERDRKLQQTGHKETEEEKAERIAAEKEAKRRFNAMLEKEGQAMKMQGQKLLEIQRYEAKMAAAEEAQRRKEIMARRDRSNSGEFGEGGKGKKGKKGKKDKSRNNSGGGGMERSNSSNSLAEQASSNANSNKSNVSNSGSGSGSGSSNHKNKAKAASAEQSKMSPADQLRAAAQKALGRKPTEKKSKYDHVPRSPVPEEPARGITQSGQHVQLTYTAKNANKSQGRGGRAALRSGSGSDAAGGAGAASSDRPLAMGCVKICFSMRCWAPSAQAGPECPVYMMSSLFGCGDVYCSVAMQHVPEPRQDADKRGSSLWKLEFDVPQYVGYFSYKYTAWNENSRWEEDGPLRIANLMHGQSPGSASDRTAIRITDVFEYATPVNDEPQHAPPASGALPHTYPSRGGGGQIHRGGGGGKSDPWSNSGSKTDSKSSPWGTGGKNAAPSLKQIQFEELSSKPLIPSVSAPNATLQALGRGTKPKNSGSSKGGNLAPGSAIGSGNSFGNNNNNSSSGSGVVGSPSMVPMPATQPIMSDLFEDDFQLPTSADDLDLAQFSSDLLGDDDLNNLSTDSAEHDPQKKYGSLFAGQHSLFSF